MKKANIMSSVIVAAIAILFFYLSLGFKKLESQELGAAFMPQVYTVVLLGLAIILFVQGLRTEKPVPSENPKLVLMSIGVIFIYILLTPLLGFYISTLAAVSAHLWFSKVRKPISLILGSVLITLFVYVFFQRLLDVPIPLGVFFS